MQTECKVCSPHCILHPACVLLSVCSQHFTLSLHFTPGPHSAFYTDFSQTLLESNWTHTDPVYLTFTWENRKFQLNVALLYFLLNLFCCPSFQYTAHLYSLCFFSFFTCSWVRFAKASSTIRNRVNGPAPARAW